MELLIDEDRLVAEATGNPPVTYTDDARGLAGPGGAGDRADRGHRREASARGMGRFISATTYLETVLDNSLGRYDRGTRSPAWRVFERDHVGLGPLIVPELAEAASWTGDAARLTAALDWITERADLTPDRLGARHAGPGSGPPSDGEAAEALLPRVARAARPEPRSASSSPARTCCTASGCAASAGASTRASSCAPPRHARRDGRRAFAERARRELRATGETRPQAPRRDARSS